MKIKMTNRENRKERPRKTVFMTEVQVEYIREEMSKEVEGVVAGDNNEMKEYKIEELDSSRKTNYRKGQNLSKDEVINLFNEISSDAKNNNYYVGITCNPEQREEAHNADFLAVVDCPSMEAAKELEKSADKYGFDAGSVQGNVHKSSSKKVYIYKKTQKTKE